MSKSVESNSSIKPRNEENKQLQLFGHKKKD